MPKNKVIKAVKIAESGVFIDILIQKIEKRLYLTNTEIMLMVLSGEFCGIRSFFLNSEADDLLVDLAGNEIKGVKK